MPAQRSAWPRHAGVPAWGAVLIAVSATLAGFAIEAGLGHSELGGTFAVFYALGCLGAVLAVRQSGVFTAIIQPPLVLFVAVPTAYFLFHGSAFAGLKDILITCGYPLIERFPLMLLTSVGVLLIGAIRWYLHQAGHQGPARSDAAAPAGPGRLGAMAARLSSLLARPEGAAGRPRHGIDRSARPPRSRPEAARSRTGRPPGERRRSGQTYQDPYREPPRPRRRPPVEADPRERPRRTQSAHRNQGRTPPPQRRETRDRGRRHEQFPPPNRTRQPYQSYPGGYPEHPEDYPPRTPRRRPVPGGTNGSHHPVSRVRYRGAADDAPGGYPERPRR